MKSFFYLVAAPVLAIFVCGCGGPPNATSGEEQKDEHAADAGGHTEDITLTPEAQRIAGIEIEGARRMPMQSELKVGGVVTNTAHGKAVVTSPVDGRITRLLVKPGDNVRAGQAIAALSSSDLAVSASEVGAARSAQLTAEAALKESSSQVDLALVRLSGARSNLVRQKQLARAGAFSQAALQTVQRDLNEAEAELENAMQEEVVHQAQLERAERLYKQQLISRTELEAARLEVQQDKTRQTKAKRQIAIAQEAYKREREIAERGLLTAREVQTAEAEVRSADLEVRQARIRRNAASDAVAGAARGLRNAQTAYSAMSSGGRASGASITVTAPIGGVITHREVSVGQAVERTTEICEIENLRSVLVTANVSERDIAKVREGERAQVSVKAYPNRIFVGVVQVAGARLEPKSRTMPVLILVDNTSGALRTAMFANVALGYGTRSDALVVRRTAVVEDGDVKSVFVAEGSDKFEQRAVSLGRAQGEFVEVTNGLQPGDRVVVKGAFVLKSEKVKGQLKGHEH